MNISRISRSIVVAIYVVLIGIFIFLDITILHSNNNDIKLLFTLRKVVYVISTIILVLGYAYIKDKLYHKKVKKKFAYIYRYIYISFAIGFCSIYTIIGSIKDFSNKELIFYYILTFFTATFIKRIIFNISKSDILSVLGMFMYCNLLNNIYNKIQLFTTLIITFSLLLTILLTNLLIDELKQSGIKTKKYLMEAILLGICIGFCIITGINYIVWSVILVIMICITSNLDNTHITFPKKFMATLTQSQRENLYKIERININKLYVSIVIVLATCIFIVNFFELLATRFGVDIYCSNIIINTNIKISDFILYLKSTLIYSSKFYLFLSIYILFIEIVTFFLRRKYDTKTTFIKSLFMAILIINLICNYQVIYYQKIFMALYIIIAIINTSNIYLNREERIKMLISR